MDLKENWEKIKPYRDYKQILDFLEHILMLHRNSVTDFNYSLSEDIFLYLGQVAASSYKISFKSSVDSIIRSLQRIASEYPNPPLIKEFCIFHNEIGKTWKSSKNLINAEKSFKTGIDLAQSISLLHPIHVHLLLNLCKTLNIQSRLKESLSISKEAVEICQDIVMDKFISNNQLADLTCKTYLQVSIQEELLGNRNQSLIWIRKAERILIQKKDIDSRIAIKVRKCLEKFSDKGSEINEQYKTARKFMDIAGKQKIQRIKQTSTARDVGGSFNPPRRPNGPSGSKGMQNSFSRKKIKASNVNVGNKSKEEFYQTEAGLRSPFEMKNDRFQNFNDLVTSFKDLGVTVAVQTDWVLPQTSEAWTSTEPLEPDPKNQVEKEEKELKALISSSVRIKSDEIDIKFDVFQVDYYLTNNYSEILVVLSKSKLTLSKCFPFTKDTIVLDFISNDLQPRLDIEKGQIIIAKEETKSLISEATLIYPLNKVNLEIYQKSPRLEIMVRAVNKNMEKTFRLSQILPAVPSQMKSPELLILCFDAEQDEIQLANPENTEIKLLYARNLKIGNLKIFLKVSRLQFETCNKYLFHSTSFSTLASLVIEEKQLADNFEIKPHHIEDNIEKICTFLIIKASKLLLEKGKIEVEAESIEPLTKQVTEKVTEQEFSSKIETDSAIKLQSAYRGYLFRKTIEKDNYDYFNSEIDDKVFKVTIIDSTINRKMIIEALEHNRTYYLVLKYPVPYKQPFAKSIKSYLRLKSKNLVLKNPVEHNFCFVFKKDKVSAEENAGKQEHYGFDQDEIVDKEITADKYNKIIYRTCIKKNNMMYLITMKLIKDHHDNILHFFVRSGPNPSDNQKFVIDLKTICTKSGIPVNNLDAIGNYVVKNMVTFAGNDVSFLNYERKNKKTEEYIVKLQAFFRGMLARKKNNSRPIKVLNRKYIQKFDKTWVCFFKSDAVNFYVQIISNKRFHNKSSSTPNEEPKSSLGKPSENEMLYDPTTIPDKSKFTPIMETITLDLNKVLSRNSYPNVKDYFNKELFKKIDIVEEGGKFKIVGLEEFLIEND